MVLFNEILLDECQKPHFFSISDVQFAVGFYNFLKLMTRLLWGNSHADFTLKSQKALLNDGSSVMGLRIFSILFILINHHKERN